MLNISLHEIREILDNIVLRIKNILLKVKSIFLKTEVDKSPPDVGADRVSINEDSILSNSSEVNFNTSDVKVGTSGITTSTSDIKASEDNIIKVRVNPRFVSLYEPVSKTNFFLGEVKTIDKNTTDTTGLAKALYFNLIEVLEGTLIPIPPTTKDRVYDKDSDGIVDDSEKFGGRTPDEFKDYIVLVIKSDPDIADAISKKHPSSLLGTKEIDEGNIGDGKFIKFDATQGKLVYTEGGSGTGVNTFLELTDTPSSYADQANKVVRVKEDETGLEFAEVSGMERHGNEWHTDNFSTLTIREVKTDEDIADAISKKHPSSLLGTKEIDEGNIGDGKFIKFDEGLGKLVYTDNVGDMSKSIYDADNDGIVDNANLILDGVLYKWRMSDRGLFLESPLFTSRIYVANTDDGNLSVIDGKTNTVVATIDVGKHLYNIAVNPATNKIYVIASDNSLLVIDGETNTVITTISVGEAPWGIEVNPVTNRIYVANGDSNNVSVIDGANNTVIATIEVGEFPTSIAVNTATNRIYVTNAFSNSVSVINSIDNTIITTISVGVEPYGVAINPITNRIYVTNSLSDNISVIDGETNTVITTISVGSHPHGIVVDSITNKIYVANIASNDISVIDGETNTVITTISIGEVPSSIAIDSTANRIYVTNIFSDNVSVIDTETNTVIATVSVGRWPLSVAILKYTDKIHFITALSEIKSDPDIADAISKKHPSGLLGTKEVDEESIGEGKFIIYSQNKLRYSLPKQPVTVRTTSGSIGVDDGIVIVDATRNSIFITLPSAADVPGREFTIKKIDAINPVIVQTINDQMIDGTQTIQLTNQWEFIKIVSDGNNWIVVGQNI